MTKTITYAALFLLSIGLLQLSLSAQTERADLTGTVTDPQGNRIPQAEVLAVNAATGLKRTTVTSSQGTYQLADLPPGVYNLQVTKEGFSTFQADAVRQTVGETRILNIMLRLAGKKQETTVTESLVQLDKVDVTIGGAIEEEQVNELPINGRNWSTLTSLAPGAIDNGAGDQRTIRFAGHGLDDNNLTLDGVDATAVFNQMQREYVRLTIPLDSIAEFDVKSQTFGADVEGGTAGGQVAVVSSSGTNSFHGDLFDYFRNDAIEARTPFNGASPNPFLLNQFGAGVGGPIKKNKLFFFANYEGLRQRLDGTQIGLVPSPAFRQNVALTSPALVPVLDAYPGGTSPTTNPNVWNYIANGRQIDNEDSGMIRIDYHYSNQTTAFVRFNSDEAYSTTPTGNLTALTLLDNKFNNGEFELLHVFTPTLVSEAKFAVNQDIYHSGTLSPLAYTFNVTGFSAFAGDTTSDYPSKTISVLDDWSWLRGRHTIKFGFEIKRDFLNQGTSSKGTISYSGLADFQNNLINTGSYTALLPLVRQRKTQYFVYAEDEWKVTENLTLNAGVRYNLFNALHALNNDAAPFDLGTCGGFCPSNYSFFHPRYADLDPRLGIAWSQKLPYDLVGTASYLGNKATNVLTTTYVNLAVPPRNLVPYPAYGAVSWRGDVGNSTFEALQLNVRRTFQNGFLVNANYMWSHSINDGSIGGGESDTPQDSFCRSCDKASSDDDIRHMLNLSAVYRLPFRNRIWGNWELSAIGAVQTGLPVNITVDRSNASVPGLFSISGSERPNYNYGVSLLPLAGQTPADWINLAAFSVPAKQTFGNLGRNAFRAPGISQLDLGVSKFFNITEKLNLRLRADVFNVFNRAQYGAPNADISLANFGVITSTISNYAAGRGTPRELQLSARLAF